MTDNLTQPEQALSKTQKARQLFQLEYAVATEIEAPRERIWKYLTDAPAFKSWNSTVLKLEGDIAAKSQLCLVSTLAPKQTFKLTVSHFQPPESMVWQSGNALFGGQRTYTLTPRGGKVLFSMREVFRGLMLPLIAGVMPDFCENFEQFAADLKRVAEA